MVFLLCRPQMEIENYLQFLIYSKEKNSVIYRQIGEHFWEKK